MVARPQIYYAKNIQPFLRKINHKNTVNASYLLMKVMIYELWLEWLLFLRLIINWIGMDFMLPLNRLRHDNFVTILLPEIRYYQRRSELKKQSSIKVNKRQMG